MQADLTGLTSELNVSQAWAKPESTEFKWVKLLLNENLTGRVWILQSSTQLIKIRGRAKLDLKLNEKLMSQAWAIQNSTQIV